jgi:hypothetical protein
MGYAFATGYCISCGNLFTFNPMRVPSTSAITGKREPICLSCITIANEKRIALGLEPFAIANDAYDAIDENEL